MFRSISTRSSSRLNASTNQLVTLTHRRKSNPCSITKTLSLILNKIDFSMCNPPDDTEMHEFIRYTNSEENLSISTISDKTIINQRSLFPHRTCTKTMHRTLSQLKNKLIHRHEQSTTNHEKNNGYLVIETADSEPVLISNDTIDHQQTQHAQPCVQINDTNFDLNQIQYTSVTPITNNISPPAETSLELYIPNFNIHLNHELDAQSTRSSVECGVPQADFCNIYDTQVLQLISTRSSSSTTNSSTHEYSGIDRSVLDDSDYVKAQRFDLERLINFEITLMNELHGLKLELEEQLDFNGIYDETMKENLKLKKDLAMLQEEYDRFYSTWSCELCTYINRPYCDTHCDSCEMCESPSPAKRATLIQ